MKRDYVLCNPEFDYFINPLGLHPEGASLWINKYSNQRLQPVNSPANGFFLKAENSNQYLPYKIDTGNQTISGRILLRTSIVKPALKIAVIGDSYINSGYVTQGIKTYDTTTTLYGILEGAMPGNYYTGLPGWNARNVLEDSSYNGYENPMWNNGKFDFKNFADLIELPDDGIVILNFGVNVVRQGDSPQKALNYYLKLKREVEKAGYTTFIVSPVTTAEIGMNVKLSEFAELLRKTIRSGLLDVSWFLPPNYKTTTKTTNSNFGSMELVSGMNNLIHPNEEGYIMYGRILLQTLMYHLGYGVT